ncbi:MAG: CNNM domain-containing protein [Elusimicrobiota bacterium]|mgnify:CR=1 FL=1
MFSILTVAVVLIALNAFFVAMEFALVKVRTSRIEVLARKGSTRALVVQEMQSRLDDFLAASQFGITLIGLALGWMAEPALAAFMAPHLERLSIFLPAAVLHGLSLALALIVLSTVHIVLGELVPRSIGIQRPDSVALWGAIPLRAFALIFRLPIRLMSWLSTSLLGLFGFKTAAEGEPTVSEEEMRVLLGDTHEKGTFPLERLLLLENLFDFGSAKVSEAMVPREKVAFLSLSKTWEQNLETIRARKFSRYPLCSDELDSVVGFVLIKDLILKDAGPSPDLKLLRRDLTEVSESEPLEKLLKSFPDKGIQISVVRNAAGQITGLLTLEDIIEELIGEVHDEYDLPGAWSLMDLVPASAVAVGLQAPDRRSAVTQLLAKLKAAHPELDEEDAFKTVWEREMKFSSAVGHGAAVPHGRLLNLERPMVAIGRFAKPVPFPSPDNMPVRLVFLILTPASTPVVQLKVLGRIASLLTNENLRRKLLRAKTSEAMLDILRTGDTLLAA